MTEAMETEAAVEENGPTEAKKTKMTNEQITIQFETEAGERPFPPLSVPVGIDPEKLKVLLKAFLIQKIEDGDADEDEDGEEETAESIKDKKFLFYLDDREIEHNLEESMLQVLINKERTVPVVFKPQSVFRVKPVTRCTSSMPGHTQPVVVAQFSPDGRHLASGSGDNTVRFWDVTTETPKYEGKVHRQYVLALSWAPDGSKLASGDKMGHIIVWNPETGQQMGKALTGHRQYITALAWQPLHLCNGDTVRKLASASKDGDVKIWDTSKCSILLTMSGHTKSVTCLKWGGSDLIYSASQDRTIKVWRGEDGVLCRTLQGHGHWVNVLALNTDYVMRTGAFDPSKATVVHESSDESLDKLKAKAEKRYKDCLGKLKGKKELMVSGSDDYTLFLWSPTDEKKSLARMTGHQQLVNDVKFSPDARIIASASFDKSIRLWDGVTGRFMSAMRGHVQAVYQLAWSADSRLLVSGSADSTLKLWGTKPKKEGSKNFVQVDLPGHGDEIYAVDWSPDGQRVVSGGKDTLLRIWRR